MKEFDMSETYRLIAKRARDHRQLLDVWFRLDDGTLVKWHVGVARIEATGFWTPGNFFIAWKAIERNGLREIEEAA